MSIRIGTLDVSEVTRSVQAMLLEAAGLKAVAVERSAEENTDPARCPWVGIYSAANTLPVRTLGVGAGYRQQRIRVLVLVQESDPRSGELCEDRTNLLVKQVLDEILSDCTLRGVVQTLDEVDVQYPSFVKINDEQYMQTAVISFIAITPTEATSV